MSVSSVLKDISNVEHSTAAWFEKEWAVLHKELPTIVQLTDKILPYVKLLLQTVITAEFGAAAGAETAKVLTVAQSDIDVANALVYDTGATPTAASAISAVQSNLSAVLAATGVKNSQSVATVTKAVSELGTLATAITNASPTPAP